MSYEDSVEFIGAVINRIAVKLRNFLDTKRILKKRISYLGRAKSSDIDLFSIGTGINKYRLCCIILG